MNSIADDPTFCIIDFLLIQVEDLTYVKGKSHPAATEECQTIGVRIAFTGIKNHPKAECTIDNTIINLESKLDPSATILF